ncbi:Leucine-rich repeat [Arabidopsis thaliana x Arabidopsis arenosa]|nr:Leucine-rich repeat [Arabidopsis thaliana x Arabidopsis arenosa]OAP18485.1 RLP14 [Arabidopsis thaliana]
MISKTEDSGLDSVLPTWTNDTKSNCCRWEGLKCNQTSGRIIELSIGKTDFKESSLLNLSLLHPFEEVRSLNLSGEGYNQFNGLFDDVEGYESLRRLRNLEILDLSSNSFNNSSIFPFLNAATSLTTLFIQSNYIGGPLPIKELKNLTKLELLDLSGSGYNGIMPEFTHLEKLKALDLSANYFSSLVELQELKVLTNLEVLGLAWNNLDGPIPEEVVCELKNLRQLDLHGNHFKGQLPVCLGNLNKLRVLDLSSNQLSGNLPASFNSLESLEYLSLSDNNFEGFFSLNPLANLTKLKVFRLSSTSEMLQVETESNWLPKFQLTVAALPFCSLGKIPNFLVYQTNLRLVDLSSNRLSGDIPTWLLENNPELKVLQLKNNSFTTFQIPTIVHKLQVLDFSANDITGVLPDNIGHVLPRLLLMNGSDNGFQGNLPSSMGEMNDISFLDLSYNNFSGELPRSLLTGCFSLVNLQLSHNSFSGPILPIQTRLTSLIVLRMHNNLFTGEIGVGFRTLVNLSIFDASNNRLTGLISSSIPPDSSYLMMLLLSNNLLEGTLPPSLLAIHHLNFLDLSGNLLSGDLPSSVVNSMYGIKIFLHNNSFTGPLPVTLLENAYILDLRNNKLSGSIPQFVNIGKMITLLLRGNNLTGSIPRKLCDLTSIRLLDLSDNKLNGVIPPCLNRLSTELGEGIGLSSFSQGINFGDSLQMEFYRSTFLVDEFMLYYDSTYMIVEIEFAAKQRYDSFSGGTLDYMYGLDLSSNELSGVIPAELGDLSNYEP